MTYILPQTQIKKAISKIENGRLMYENVAPNQVQTMEVAGWVLSQIDMTRSRRGSCCGGKFKFEKIFAPNVT